MKRKRKAKKSNKNKRRKITKTKKKVKKNQFEDIKKNYVDFQRIKIVEKNIKDSENPSLTYPLVMSIVVAETYKKNPIFQEINHDKILEELKIYFPYFI